MAKVKFKIEGMKELQKSLKKLGDVPQRHVTNSARKAMNIVKKEAQNRAPYESGALEKGIKSVGEKSRHKGKKVYQLVFDRAMNDIFQKPIQKPGSRGGQGKDTGYYPYSMEYGYFAGHGNYIPGFRFIHHAFNDNTRTVEKTIVSEMKKKIDQEIARGGLKW